MTSLDNLYELHNLLYVQNYLCLNNSPNLEVFKVLNFLLNECSVYVIEYKVLKTKHNKERNKNSRVLTRVFLGRVFLLPQTLLEDTVVKDEM